MPLSDVITRADDAFLVAHDMRKGGMALIDEARAAQVYDAMGPAVEISGGSAANTIVGVAGFGARSAFVGKIKDDQLGAAFAHDIRAAGVDFDTPPAATPIWAQPRISIRATSTPTPWRVRRSPISKAICGTPPTPRKPSSRPRPSPMRPGAWWR
jgi:hypothetical protein